MRITVSRLLAPVLAGLLVVPLLALTPIAHTPPAAGAATPPERLVIADDEFGGHGALFQLDVDAPTPIASPFSTGNLLEDPSGLAVDHDGYLLVADRSALGGDGAVIRVRPDTGEQVPITSGRFLVDPTGVVVEADGGILVVDADARDANGAAGVGGVIRVDPDTGVQSLVSSGGMFADPSGIALEADGEIVVADPAAFGDGGVIRVDPVTGAQHEVASAGDFGSPSDLVVAPGGDILVIDRDWDRGDGGVVRIPAGSNGVHPTVAANEVTASDDWGNPTGIELGPDGTIYVADPDRDATYTVDPDGGATRVLSTREDSGHPDPVGLVMAPITPPPPSEPPEQMRLVVADADAADGSGALFDLTLETPFREAVLVSDDVLASGGRFSEPRGVAVDTDGFLLVADQDAYIGSYGGVIRVHPTTGAQATVSSAVGFVNPSGVAVEPDGGLLVVDPDAHDGQGGVLRVDRDTNVQDPISVGAGYGNPAGIAVEPDGGILVADPDWGTNGAVIRVDPHTQDREVVASGGDFVNPSALAVEPDGDILVVDPDWDGGDGGIVRIPAGSTGIHPTVEANELTGPDEWGNPLGIALAPDGTILVADPDYSNPNGGTGAVVRVDPVDGDVAPVAQLSGFRSPVGLAVVPSGPPEEPPTPTGAYAPAAPSLRDNGPCAGTYRYEVPPGVTRLGFAIEGRPGQEGREGSPLSGSHHGGHGGFGARVTGTIGVTPGQVLYADYGGTPGVGTPVDQFTPGDGNGGRLAYLSLACDQSWIAVAGGGGGGGAGDYTQGGWGGDAGSIFFTNGRSGGSGCCANNKPGRGGAGGNEGGSGGPGGGIQASGRSGSPLAGGDAGHYDGNVGAYGKGEGGGGGAGWIGGGGGGQGEIAGGGGGGAGSAWIDDFAVTDGSIATTRERYGSNLAVFTPLEVTTTLALSAGPDPVEAGQSVTLTASVGPAPLPAPVPRDPGTVTFRIDGQSVAGPVPVDPDTGLARVTPDIDLAEGAHTVDALYSGNGFLTGASATAPITVHAPRMPTIIPRGGLTTEGQDGTHVLDVGVELSEPSEKTVTVDWETVDTAEPQAGVDYDSASGTVTFLPGQTAAVVPITVHGDTLDEGSVWGAEWGAVRFHSPTNATIGTGWDQIGLALIVDDDPPPTIVPIGGAVIEGDSGTTTLHVRIDLSAPSGLPVTVDWATIDTLSQPEAGVDYEPAAGTITFAPGETSRTVPVTVHGDTLDEPGVLYDAEWGGVALSSPENAKLGSGWLAGVALALIVDDD